eukprot:734297-Pleurochrysis_carterae.AAC.3
MAQASRARSRRMRSRARCEHDLHAAWHARTWRTAYLPCPLDFRPAAVCRHSSRSGSKSAQADFPPALLTQVLAMAADGRGALSGATRSHHRHQRATNARRRHAPPLQENASLRPSCPNAPQAPPLQGFCERCVREVNCHQTHFVRKSDLRGTTRKRVVRRAFCSLGGDPRLARRGASARQH